MFISGNLIADCRSGSTLLETMLDSHADIWGMGEDSIFNGRLTEFRDDIVRIIGDKSHRLKDLQEVVVKHGDYVQGKMIEQALNFTDVAGTSKPPKHVVDKMLFNYRNIGSHSSSLIPLPFT